MFEAQGWANRCRSQSYRCSGRHTLLLLARHTTPQHVFAQDCGLETPLNSKFRLFTSSPRTSSLSCIDAGLQGVYHTAALTAFLLRNAAAAKLKTATCNGEEPLIEKFKLVHIRAEARTSGGLESVQT